MPEDSFNQNTWPGEKSGQNQPPSLDTGEGESPLAKPSEVPEVPQVDVRTSASDVKSMQESGGGSPRSYTPPPPAGGNGGQQAPSPSAKKQSFSQVFKPPQVEQPSAAPAKLSSSLEGMQISDKKSKKGLFLGILALIIVIGVAAVGYFFVYPIFFQASEEVEVPQESVLPLPSETPIVPEIPVIPEVPAVSPGDEQVEEETGTLEESSLTPTVTEHTSLFKTSADLSEDASLSAFNLSSVREAIQFTTAEVPVFKEIVLKDSEGNFVSLSGLMDVLLAGIFTSDVVGTFELDLTVFVYTDDKGTWPGYVMKLKSDSVLVDAKSSISQIENDTNITNLFLTDPGSSATWKSGQVEGVSNRYLTFSQSGAGLNYGWLNNTLVIGTSYSGFQEALKRLK